MVFPAYPIGEDRHQERSAAVPKDAMGALVVRDMIDPVVNVSGDAGRALGDVLADTSRRRAMRGAIHKLGPTDGAERVAVVLRGLGE